MTKRAIFVMLMAVTGIFAEFMVAQKDGLMRRPAPINLAAEDVKEILLLMDPDKQGKITKEAWMKFMAAEFDRLDTNKCGALDPKKLQLVKEPLGHARASDLGR